MKRTHITSLAIFGLMMVGVLAFTATTANAQCEATVAGIESLNFGLLSAPSNGSCDEWTMELECPNTATLTHSGSGDGFDFISTDHNYGSFKLNGDQLIFYDAVVTTDFADPNLTLYNLILCGPAQNDQPLDCAVDFFVNVGGTLRVCPDVALGPHGGAVITLTANY